jgi:hypothetical protein
MRFLYFPLHLCTSREHDNGDGNSEEENEDDDGEARTNSENEEVKLFYAVKFNYALKL